MEVSLRSQAQFDVEIRTTEMHTGGEPVRIIESGFPIPQGRTILEKIEYLRKNHDGFRKLVIAEPHGHFDMYGVLIVAPDHTDADFGVIFLHNEGYGPMCGHACISLGRYAVDKGLVRRPIESPETECNVQTPCGLVKLITQVNKSDGVVKTGRVRFESVPCFVNDLDVEIELEGLGKIKVDVVYGGAFYAFVQVDDLGLRFGASTMMEMREAATRVKVATRKVVHLSHPETPAFMYGVMIVDTRDKPPADVSTNTAIFADQETDRSPCGSGTSARVALMHHRGHLKQGEGHTFRSGVTGSEFTGRVVRPAEPVEGKKAFITEIEGQGYYSGHATLTLESNDVLGKGFLVR